MTYYSTLFWGVSESAPTPDPGPIPTGTDCGTKALYRAFLEKFPSILTGFYLEMAPDGATFPYAVQTAIGSSDDGDTCDPESDGEWLTEQIQITVFAQNDDVTGIARAIRTAIHRKTLSMDVNFVQCFVTSWDGPHRDVDAESGRSGQDAFYVRLTVEITYTIGA